VSKPTAKQTAAALEKSIAHWKRLATGTQDTLENTGPGSCALCQLFWGGLYDRCEGCPVKDETGQRLCHGTPYSAASEIGIGNPGFKSAARKELKFLESLRRGK
jgi:hypothetical protein